MNTHSSKFGYASREEADEVTRTARSKPWAEPFIRIESYDGRDTERVQGSKAAADVWNSWIQRSRAPTHKLASATPVQAAPPAGVATRLKKRQRGWHYEAEPGFHDVKGKFEDAARKNPEIKVAAIADALKTYGIDPKYAGEISDAPDPVKALTQVLKTKDFGFGGQKSQGRGFGEFASWGPPSGMTGGDSGSRVAGGALMGGQSYGGV